MQLNYMQKRMVFVGDVPLNTSFLKNPLRNSSDNFFILFNFRKHGLSGNGYK